MSKIGTNIKYLRQKRKISQGELAQALEMNRGNIASYEGGKALPGAEKLLAIANYFDADISDLIHEDLAGEVQLKSKPASALAESLDELKAHVGRMRKVLGGFREYHEIKKSKEPELPENYKYLRFDYERLLDMMDDYQETYEKLLQYIERQAKEITEKSTR